MYDSLIHDTLLYDSLIHDTLMYDSLINDIRMYMTCSRNSATSLSLSLSLD